METYEIYGKHTFFPMGINAVCLIVLLILLAALYKELAPNTNTRTGGETYHVTAKFDVFRARQRFVTALISQFMKHDTYFYMQLYFHNLLKCIIA